MATIKLLRSCMFFLIICIGAMMLPSSISAKIGDPQPVQEENKSYKSHSNKVWATDMQTQSVLWETVIPMDEYIGSYNPHLEEDVQWNIINSIKIENDVLVVQNSKGEIFHLEKATGKLLKRE